MPKVTELDGVCPGVKPNVSALKSKPFPNIFLPVGSLKVLSDATLLGWIYVLAGFKAK